ncbi:uncharacterized protein PFL1_00285 [Pseudozyma flocculosa PF-1]|uniref:Multiple myeloma tumor-associated protein 2-like N-terminal domain-containing protein n=1 Tax=Pseudozyma flocculosa TaxID=84751 RepID=A0A5C3ERP5_9BASI|nr:uncharacterized protein PFL1_00285 [Pseudozyma flocculosa PF-1]EPQ32087.1 hypothetical protein PFL1_00285 [Pseudozyma flocculosa PF-1]SPO34983.1 uncharacterized protein PSFLO_00454 [Pseudozyma flocculosa]
MYHQSRPGARGGAGNFSWEDVKNDKDREFYLGNSVNAPQGRWQAGRDIHWYNKDKASDKDEERREELRRVKKMEEEALYAKLGIAPPAATLGEPAVGSHLLAGASASSSRGARTGANTAPLDPTKRRWNPDAPDAPAPVEGEAEGVTEEDRKLAKKLAKEEVKRKLKEEKRERKEAEREERRRRREAEDGGRRHRSRSRDEDRDRRHGHEHRHRHGHEHRHRDDEPRRRRDDRPRSRSRSPGASGRRSRGSARDSSQRRSLDDDRAARHRSGPDARGTDLDVPSRRDDDGFRATGRPHRHIEDDDERRRARRRSPNGTDRDDRHRGDRERRYDDPYRRGEDRPNGESGRPRPVGRERERSPPPKRSDLAQMSPRRNRAD